MPKSELSHTQKLAGVLHDLMCQNKLTENCSWWYCEDPLNDPENPETKLYVSKARLLEKRPLTMVVDFLQDLFGRVQVDLAFHLNNLSSKNTS